MKKSLLFFLIPLLAVACGKTPTTETVVQGQIKGLGNDTILLYGTNRFYDRVDTLTATDGKFTARLTTDTLIDARLLFADGTELPIFFDRGDRIRIEGEAGHIGEAEVTGTPDNDALTHFRKAVAALPAPTERELELRADSFIKSHASSIAALYVLDKYFVQKADPNLKRIEALVEPMTGELKDRRYVELLLSRAEEQEKITAGRTAPYFSVPNAEGEKKSRNNFRDKYVLLQFWASWDARSREANAALRRIYKQEQKNENIAFIGLSLDVDRQAWLDAIDRDTLQWEQLCDLKGWKSQLVEQFALQQLPKNLLIDTSGRIVKCDLTEEQLKQEIKLANQKIKEKKKREKANKKTKN